MKNLRISSRMNLHAAVGSDVVGFLKNELEFLKKMGFDAADFDTRILTLDGATWQKAAEAAYSHSKKLGIEIETCHLPYVFGSKHSEEFYKNFDKKMKNAIQAAKLLGVKYAVTHPNTDSVPRKSFDRAMAYDTVMSHLAPFVEYADKLGVNIVIENMRLIGANVLSHRYCQDPDELCDIADALGVGVCWDFGHANISGVKQSEGLRYVGKRLKVTHVNDNHGIDDVHLPPFVGNIDWRDAISGLREIGYEGAYNLELETSKIPQSAREPFARYILSAANAIMSL